jgi:hypothetical protein
MQQVYLKRMTKQDITKSVTICIESVKSFWGIDPDMTNEYVPISICHEDNTLYLPDGITIHKGYQGIKDWRICGNEWKKLYAHENPEEGDIMAIRKLGSNSFSVKIIKKDSDIYNGFSSLFVGNDNYSIITTDMSDDLQLNKESLQQIIITDKNLRAFVLKTIKHFSDKDGLESLVPYAVTNPNDEDNKRIKIYKEGEFNLVGMFINTTSEDVKLRNKDHQRWFEDSFKLGGREVFLSTQWNGNGYYPLLLTDFVELIRTCYGNNYSYKKGPNGEHQLYIKGENLGNFSEKQPLQQIFYGAPGTGKSFTIDKETKNKSVIRTTFHPDSDYSTFVGTYKPTMESAETRVVPVVFNNGISLDQNKGTYTESKITYKFVKQAFLKAYINAWRSFADSNVGSSQKSTVRLTAQNNKDTWILYDVNSIEVSYLKESLFEINEFEDVVKKRWDFVKNSDDPDNYKPGTFEMYEYLPCSWYKSNCEDDDIWSHSADDCWNAFKKELEEKGKIEVIPGSWQTYSFEMVDNNTVKITSPGIKPKKIKIQEYFDGKKNTGDSIQKNIAKKMKEYNLPFNEAWDKLGEEVNNNRDQSSGIVDLDSIPPQFLVIEEINRGNCAQIFGDLFQLLDRKNGFSEYPIEADEDIRKCLISESTEEDPSFGEKGLHFTANQTDLINGVFNEDSNSPSRDVAKEIACGKVLVLPPNLYIWATMNTSDQSLFPIDSAFKRRWDWEYIPIGYKNDNWKIKIGTKEYNWVDFQRKINDKIYSVDNSEDKQLGDYFVNADQTGNGISSDTLLNKILFYLWNDVCKDDPDIIFKWVDDQDNNKEKSIKFSEFFCEEKERKLQGFMAFLKIKADGDDEKKVEQNDDTTAANDDVVNS